MTPEQTDALTPEQRKAVRDDSLAFHHDMCGNCRHARCGRLWELVCVVAGDDYRRRVDKCAHCILFEKRVENK